MLPRASAKGERSLQGLRGYRRAKPSPPQVPIKQNKIYGGRTKHNLKERTLILFMCWPYLYLSLCISGKLGDLFVLHQFITLNTKP